jgi:hypothetical protein
LQATLAPQVQLVLRVLPVARVLLVLAVLLVPRALLVLAVQLALRVLRVLVDLRVLRVPRVPGVPGVPLALLVPRVLMASRVCEVFRVRLGPQVRQVPKGRPAVPDRRARLVRQDPPDQLERPATPAPGEPRERTAPRATRAPSGRRERPVRPGRLALPAPVDWRSTATSTTPALKPWPSMPLSFSIRTVSRLPA